MRCLRNVWGSVATVSIAGTILAGGTVWAQDPEAGHEEALATATSPGEGGEKKEASEEEDEKEPRVVNLIIRGEDADRFHLDLGGGWNEDDGFYGRVALTSNNLLGGGEILDVRLELGNDREVYELGYEIPFLFNRRQSLGVRLFKDASDHAVAGGADFDRKEAGAALTYGRRFGSYHSLDLQYRYADVDHVEAAFDALGEPLSRRAAYVSSALRSHWTYDRLDDRASPLRGLRLSGTLEVGGGPLGGDSEIVRSTVGVTWFRPLRRRPLRSTFGVRARLGWVGATRGELFPQQRFFLGGEDSVRGFRRQSIAVTGEDGALARDADGFPVGGDRMAQLSLEYHLLLGGPFRLVLFADGGALADGTSLALGQLRGSAGAELRVTVPKLRVPLRLIYAHNLDPLPEDRFDDLSLSLGVSF